MVKQKRKTLSDSEKLSQLLERTLRLLSHRPRSTKEIKDYLKRKETRPDLATKLVENLQERGYLDDQEFAVWWLEQRASFRPKGKFALRAELRQKGIAPEIIEPLLEKEIGNEVEVSLAKKAVEKKKGDWQKRAAFLQRRGFSWSIIKLALGEREFLKKNRFSGKRKSS